MPRTDNETFYNKAITKYGITPKGLHWNSHKSQQTRFKAICSLLPSDISKLHVVDAGCGFGDFYQYIVNNKKDPIKYTGLEAIQNIASIAKINTDQEIIVCNILEDEIPLADYYVCSGAMNILTRFETALFIKKCFEASQYGFIFNLLEGSEKKESIYNPFLPQEIIKLITPLSSKIKLHQGYLDGDFTIGMFK